MELPLEARRIVEQAERAEAAGRNKRALELSPALYRMVIENFRVVATRPNAGNHFDRNKVPKVLVEAGVDPFPCCRELSLVHLGLVGSAAVPPPAKKQRTADDPAPLSEGAAAVGAAEAAVAA